ncbi:MAG: cation-transporting P-type ATPase [Dehalococcoidales bacterium]
MGNQFLDIKNTSEYKESSVSESINLLQSSLEGLTNAEARQRLLKFGFNEVSEKKQNSFFAFLKRYWGAMPWLLELAIILSVALKHYLEAGIIFTLLTINTVIGQIQSRAVLKKHWQL